MFYQGEMQALLTHCGEALIPIAKITSGWLQEYFNRQLTRIPKNGTKPVARTTVAIHQRAIRRLFSWATAMEFIKKNPLLKVATIKVPRDPERPTFTPLDIKAILDELRSARPSVRAFFTVLIFTGLRRSEMMRMTWTWINLEKGELSVNKPKNDKPRLIALARAALEALAALPHRKGAVWRDRETDEPMTRPPYGTLYRLLARVGISKKGFHAFRHAFCTESLEAGVALEVVQDLAGHCDPRLTRVYGKTSSERKRLGIEAFAERLESTTNVIPMPKVRSR